MTWVTCDDGHPAGLTFLISRSIIPTTVLHIFPARRLPNFPPILRFFLSSKLACSSLDSMAFSNPNMRRTMNRIQFILSLILVAGPAMGQSPVQVDSFLVADWHFDESGNSTLIDSAAYDNHCYPYGTTAVAGAKGYGRSFNGMNDYMVVGSPRLLDFTASQSFRIDFSFKTDPRKEHLEERITFSPGYMIAVRGGHLEAIVGYMEDTISGFIRFDYQHPTSR